MARSWPAPSSGGGAAANDVVFELFQHLPLLQRVGDLARAEGERSQAALESHLREAPLLGAERIEEEAAEVKRLVEVKVDAFLAAIHFHANQFFINSKIQ